MVIRGRARHPLVAAVAVAVAVLFASLVAPASLGASSRAPRIVTQALNTTSLGLSTQLDFVDQLSASLGFAIAAPAQSSHGHVDLVRTTDQGRRWTIVAPLPISITSFLDNYVESTNLVHFLTPTTGYFTVPHGPIFVTSDGGSTWRALAAPGQWPTYVVGADVVWVVSDQCAGPVPAYGPLRCPSVLSRFRIGATSPNATTIIPARGPGRAWRAANALLAPSSSSVVVVEGGTEGEPASLLQTTDGGRTWHALGDPCQGVAVEQLLAVPRAWLLYCFGDGGMNQGLSELWRSTNAGDTWALVARESMGVRDHSRIGDVMNHLYVNGRATVLFGALGGAAGGLEYSVDGGRRWTLTAISTNGYGGAPEYVSTFGATSAIFGILGGPQYATATGTSWRELPGLPAGPFDGYPICTTQVTVRLAPTMTAVPASTLDYPIVFTNEATTPCYLNGVPVAQTVAGATRRPVGEPPVPVSSPDRGGYVVLAPHATASVVLQSDDASHYRASYCRVRIADGVTVNFDRPARFFVALPDRAVCAGVSTTRIGGIARGVVTWLS